jgi:hypothetical protein
MSDNDHEFETPECFGDLFYNNDGSHCDLYECIIRASCQLKCDKRRAPKRVKVLGVRQKKTQKKLRKVKSGVGRKRHVHSKYEVNNRRVGDRLLPILEERVDERLFSIPKSRYFNFVLNWGYDCQYHRYLRVWPKVRALQIDVLEQFLTPLELEGFEVILYTQAKMRTLKPHVGYVKVKTKKQLEKFLNVFFDWAEEFGWKRLPKRA